MKNYIPDLPTGFFGSHPADRKRFLLKGGLMYCVSTHLGTTPVGHLVHPTGLSYTVRIILPVHALLCFHGITYFCRLDGKQGKKNDILMDV